MEFKILIIEDDVLLSEELSLIIQEGGFNQIHKVYSGIKAMEKLQGNNFDCIFCDINLNESKSGLDIVEENKLWEQAHIIFLTAFNDMETLERIANLPNTIFLNKPFNDKQIISTLNIILCKKNSVQNNIKNDFGFTKRESEIAQLIVKGMANKEIALILNISHHTVDNHRKQIYKKTGATNACELLNKLLENYA